MAPADSSTPPVSPEALSEADNVGMTLALWASRFPDLPAIVSPTRRRTFGELNARVNQLAHAPRTAGLGVGDALALVCGNRAEFAEVAFACTRIGVRYTPINWHLSKRRNSTGTGVAHAAPRQPPKPSGPELASSRQRSSAGRKAPGILVES